jgi:c-di-GMP-binding flagellar brake protein YcgR
MFWRGPERRKSIRVQIRMTVHVEVAGQPRFYEAVSRDLSASGARLVLRQELTHCTPIYVEFRLPGSLQTLYCPAHVVWSKDTRSSLLPDAEASWLMGIEFVRPPRQVRRELKRFVADRLKAARGGKGA